MTVFRSLAARLVFYLLFAQIMVFISIPAFAMLIAMSGLNPEANQNWNDWADNLPRDLMIESLTRSPDGSIFIEPTSALTEYVRNNPRFRFAAFDSVTGKALAGSSESLAAAVDVVRHLQVNSMRFHIPGDADEDSVGVLRMSTTPMGRVVTAVYGFVFSWRDLLLLMRGMLRYYVIATFVPVLIVAAVIAVVVVRGGLAPLRSATEKIARINVNSLDQRVPGGEVPAEISPFIDAVNQALARLDVGVAAQKRFIANAAHELRTPVTILCARADNPDEATFRHDVKRDARRIRALLEQLLVAARIANNDATTLEVVDLGKVILEMILDYMPLAVECRRKIELDSPASPIEIRGNRRALESIISNLIDNALRAEPDGGKVIVRVRPGATIEVIDHGEGIAPDDREKIFEPFWRRSEATPGSGLGLAIVKELTSKLGGKIWIEDTPNGGATFNLSFQEICPH